MTLEAARHRLNNVAKIITFPLSYTYAGRHSSSRATSQKRKKEKIKIGEEVTQAEKREKVFQYYESVYAKEFERRGIKLKLPRDLAEVHVNELFQKMNQLAKELEDSEALKEAKKIIFRKQALERAERWARSFGKPPAHG